MRFPETAPMGALTLVAGLVLAVSLPLASLRAQPGYAKALTTTAAEQPVTGIVVAREGASPIAGAKVELLELVQGFPVLETVTSNDDGTFRFEEVADGRYGIRLSAPGYTLVARGFTAGSEREELRFEVDPSVLVRGRVIDAASGAPIEGANVGFGMATTSTDADGRFELDHIARQAPVNEISPPGAANAPIELLVTSADYLRVQHDVPRDGGVSDVLDGGTIELVLGASFELRLRDEDGQPVANASALVYPLDLRRFPTRGVDNVIVRSDETGKIRARGLPLDRDFAVQIEAEDMPQHVVTPVVASRRGTPQPRTVTMSRGVPMTGRVTTPGGEAVAGASVRLAPLVNPIAHFTWDSPEQEQGFTATAGDDGRFTLEGVAFGDFLLEVNASGRRSHRRLVRIAPSSVPGPMFVTLRPGGVEPRVAWRPSMAAALDDAVDEGAPAFLFMTMDGEVANEYTAANTLRQPGIVRLINETIPVVSSTFDHGVDDDGKCAKYGAVTCTEHTEAELPIASLFLTSVYSEVPQFVFLRPSGEVVERRMFYAGFESLRNIILRSLRDVNPQRALSVSIEYYEDLVDAMRFGDPVERASAIRDLCVFADSFDEVARTALLAADLTSLTADQELAILDRWTPGVETDRIPFVARLVRDGSPAVRAEAIRRLSAQNDDAAWQTLAFALGEASDFRTRTALERAVGVRREGEAIRLPDVSPARTRALVLALAQHADPAVLPNLFAMVTAAGDADVRNDAALALTGYASERVLGFLIERLRQGGPEQAIIARVLGDLGDRDALGALRAAMDDPSVILRISAARSLGLLGDAAAKPLLRDILEREGVDASVRVAVASALLDLGSREGVPVLIELVDHPVHGPAARARLRDAYAQDAPSNARAWQNWWDRMRRP